MFRILTREMLTPNICKMEVEAPRIAKAALPGQFLIVRADEKGERFPLQSATTTSRKAQLRLSHSSSERLQRQSSPRRKESSSTTWSVRWATLQPSWA